MFDLTVEEDEEEDEDDDGEEDDDGTPTNDDIVVEDLDQLKRLRLTDQQTRFKPLKRKKRKKGTKNGEDKNKLKHWEKLAIEQVKTDHCNCRHAVPRKEGDQTVYDWCRCKDNQHTELMERRPVAPQSPYEPPPDPTPTPPTPPPPPPPREPPKAKPRRVRKKSIGIDATEQNMTELALAYDPSAVDYDMIQEVIYYRTSSGRLVNSSTNLFSNVLLLHLFRLNQK